MRYCYRGEGKEFEGSLQESAQMCPDVLSIIQIDCRPGSTSRQTLFPALMGTVKPWCIRGWYFRNVFPFRPLFSP